MFKFVMTKNSNEIFHRAIWHNDIQRTRLILEEAMKDPRFNIDEINEEGLTALQYSCFAGNVEIADILISYGANWKIRDRVGFTLLHAAAMAGNANVVRLLLRVGLKCIVRADDGSLPIDITDKIAVIVILLRDMLDQGNLKEMQDYMLDHPQLKRNIFLELEKVKCREKEKLEILRDLPYTSHSRVRKLSDHGENTKFNEKGRSISTFSALSDSIQHLDRIGGKEINNNYSNDTNRKLEPHYETIGPKQIDKVLEQTMKLRRNGSISSGSSFSSRSSLQSNNSGGGILKNEIQEQNHQNTQRYLEERFPPAQPKQVTFNLDSKSSQLSDYISMDDYRSHNHEDELKHRAVSLTETTTFKPIPNNTQNRNNQAIYENTSNVRKVNNLSPITENLYENLPAPPIPPRAPTNNESISGAIYDEVIDIPIKSDRLTGSETDSGIDINETSGRVFALSLDDGTQNVANVSSSLNEDETYSKPLGLYYSSQNNGPVFRQRYSNIDDIQTTSFSFKSNYNMNPKYKSWNGRTLHEITNEVLAPYSSRRKLTKSLILDDNHLNENDNVNDNTNQFSENYLNPKNSMTRNYHDYNFDHQPDIML